MIYVPKSAPMPILIEKGMTGRRMRVFDEGELERRLQAGTVRELGRNFYAATGLDIAKRPKVVVPPEDLDSEIDEDEPQTYQTRDMTATRKRGRPRKVKPCLPAGRP